MLIDGLETHRKAVFPGFQVHGLLGAGSRVFLRDGRGAGLRWVIRDGEVGFLGGVFVLGVGHCCKSRVTLVSGGVMLADLMDGS